MRSWIVALRIARREARRAKGRTALIVAMIGLPVLGLSYAAATFDMQHLTPQEKVTRVIGQADLAVSWQRGQAADETPFEASQRTLIGGDDGTRLTAAGLRAWLPAGSGVTEYWSGQASVDTRAGIGHMDAYGIDLTSPITAGMAHLIGGRVPRADNEIMVSPSALDRLGATIGQTVATADGTEYVVTGVGEVAGAIRDTIVFRPTQLPTDLYRQPKAYWWLIDVPGPVPADLMTTLNRHSLFVQARALMLDPPQPADEFGGGRIVGLTPFSLGTMVAGLGLLEVILLAGPAFAMGARRRQRDLALVATNGGTPGMLRRIVLADGVVCGVVAAVTGVVAGVAIAFATRPLAEQSIFHVRMGAYRVDPLAIVGLVGVALVTGLLGALVPAFTAARVEIVTALSGRRGAIRSRLLWLLIGIAMVAVGAATAAFGAFRDSAGTVLAGLVTGELGLVLCTPTIVGWVAHLSHLLPVAPRMALRDASRRRASSAPAISAVMAAVAGSVALSVYLGAEGAQAPQYVRSLPMGSMSVQAVSTDGAGKPVSAPIDKITTAVREVLPGASVVPFQILGCPPDAPGCMVQVITPPSQQCPFWQRTDPLTKADQRQALADPRCNRRSVEGYGDGTQIVTDDPAVVAAATGLAGARLADAVATLRGGGVLVGDATQVDGGVAILVVSAPIVTTTADESTVVARQEPAPTVPAYVVATGVAMFEPIVSPAVAAAAHARPVDAGVLVSPARAPSQADEDALTAALSGVPGTSIYVERGNTDHRSPVPLMLAIAAAVIALGAAGIATGLAAADSRHDLTTLAAVGATPRVRRVLSLAQSGVIAGLGSVIGAVAGLGAAAAVLTGINSPFRQVWPAPAKYPITVPWLNLGIALIVVPLTAMMFAGLLTRSRLPSERRAD